LGVAENFVNVDRDTPMLLPADLRQWVPEDDLVHFMINAVETMRLSALRVNERGSGSKQYPPRMMLALLVYCYANGVFGSRRIERATYRDVAVRYLTGDTHPDHDTICAFRRENAMAVKQAFAEVLQLAQQMGLVKLGTVSVDGTHIKANASKHKGLRYDRAGELEKLFCKDIEELLARAEKATPGDCPTRGTSGKDALGSPGIGKRANNDEEQKSHKDDPGGSETGSIPGQTQPKASQQINLTDPDSCLMRKSGRDIYEQAYDAQVVFPACTGHRCADHSQRRE
jgi:transposase